MLVIDDHQFQRVVAFVREHFGINLSKKRALIQSRLALEIERRGYVSFERYFDCALSNPGCMECQRMIDKLSTNHTFFFREPSCFDHMQAVALPEIAARGVRRLNIWCAAASSGQECYTIAMILECALAQNAGIEYQILGSDINSEVLRVARGGVYPVAELAHIPPIYQQRFCRQVDEEHFTFAPALSRRIVWQQQNLMPPLSGFATKAYHLIFCRNVMIYFDTAAKEALTDELFRIVDDGGYVYVGSTETLDMKRTRFQYVKPSIFARKAHEQ